MTGRFSKRLAAEEEDSKLLRTDAIELGLGPVRYTSRCFQRHFLGKLVVVPVIALIAVIAGEVALQCREDRDVELSVPGFDRREVVAERSALGLRIGDQKAVLLKQPDAPLFRRR